MESEHFDSLVRCAATGAGRRRLLQAVAAVGVGGLLTRVGMGEVVAACKKRGEPCSRNSECNCKDRNVICDPLDTRHCKGKDRCCGTSEASCSSRCDCCDGFSCDKKRGECVVS
jgi:hypothetical protein